MTQWLREMEIFCRGCSDAIEEDLRRALKEFPRPSKRNLFHFVVAQGIERFCIACRKSGRIANLADEKLEDLVHAVGNSKSERKA